MFGSMHDPEAAQALHRAGVGAAVTLNVGGKTDPVAGGGPLRLSCQVRAVTDGSFVHKGPMANGVRANLGQSAVLAVGGLEVLVTSYPNQILDTEMFAPTASTRRRRRSWR